MNYNKTYNKKTAIDKIKELEKDKVELASVIGKVRQEKKELYESKLLEIVKPDRFMELESEIENLKWDVSNWTHNYRELLCVNQEMRDSIENDIKDNDSQKLNKEITRLKASIAQFRKTEQYQSEKIADLQETCTELTMDLSEANDEISSLDDKLSYSREQSWHIHNRVNERDNTIKQLKDTIIRQANEITELKSK